MSTYVWRLKVTLPEGSDRPGWSPEGWRPLYTGPEGEPVPFSWPRRRRYLSANGAAFQAGILRDYGAEVAIEQSEAVRWPEPTS